MLYVLMLWFSQSLADTVTMDEICGTWEEQGRCNDVSCSGDEIFTRSNFQYLKPTTEGDNNNYYASTLRQFQDESCEEGGSDDAMNITVFGLVNLGEASESNERWTEIQYMPLFLTAYVSNKTLSSGQTSSNLAYSFPDGSCSDMFTYLNKYCACGGQWEAGTERTVYFPDCAEGTCTAFESIKQYGNVQIPVKKVLSVSTTYTSAQEAQADTKPDQVLMQVNYEGCMFQSAGSSLTPKLGAAGGGGGGDDKEGEEDKEEENKEEQWQQYVEDSSSSSSSSMQPLNVTSDAEDEAEGINALLIYAAIGIGAAVGMVITGTWYYIASKKELSTGDYQSIQDPHVRQTLT